MRGQRAPCPAAALQFARSAASPAASKPALCRGEPGGMQLGAPSCLLPAPAGETRRTSERGTWVCKPVTAFGRPRFMPG